SDTFPSTRRSPTPSLFPYTTLFRSQVVTAPRQVVPLPTRLSVGHAVETPLHVSAMSQPPADARQVVPLLPAGCWQVSLEPLHWRSEEHTSELQSLRHLVCRLLLEKK